MHLMNLAMTVLTTYLVLGPLAAVAALAVALVWLLRGAGAAET